MFGSRTATLIFTDTAIKAVSARPTSKGFKFSFLGKKSLPASTVFNGRIINESLFREALKTFFLENYDKLKTRNIILGLNEQEVFISDIKFDEKPKNLPEEINSKLSPLLPFDLKEASIRYKELSPKNYQVIAAKIGTLSLLSRSVTDAGFSLIAIVPIPIIFPKLVGKQQSPYLFVSSEEDLIFSLVVGNTVVFSSTYTLKGPLAESEKEVLMTVSEIIELEYKKYTQEPLKNIFAYGRGTEFLKSFFNAKNFNTQIVLDSSESSKQTGYDFADYSRVIALSHYDNGVLSFPKIKSSKNIDSTSNLVKKRKINMLYLVFPIIILAIIAGILFWPDIKDSFFALTKDTGVSSSKEAATSSKKPKEATPEAKKKEATPTPEPPKEVTRKDFSVRVLNGSGIAGVAGEARDFLASKGYTIESIGNAENFDYQKMTVQIKNSKKEVSDLLTKDLKERYSINIGSPLLEGEQFDILIIVGR
ncbi:LytR C-terminal domain-containing protein [Patescibacteria group bacterium]|nr:LytR C-terminal domain-containing protein [Patescibacteria group bacterium]